MYGGKFLIVYSIITDQKSFAVCQLDEIKLQVLDWLTVEVSKM